MCVLMQTIFSFSLYIHIHIYHDIYISVKCKKATDSK